MKMVAGYRPYTLIFSTLSLDGRLASSTGYSMLSCAYDKARLLLLRGYSDAVMVGASTVLVDNPRLVKRLKPRSKKFYRVVVDGRLRLDPSLRIFRDREPRVIVFTARSDPEKAVLLESKGADVINVSDPEGRVDLARALGILYGDYGVEVLLVEGGGILNYHMVSQRLVDEIRMTITPKIFAAGRCFIEDVEGEGYPEGAPIQLELACNEPCPCGRCVHIVYRVLNAKGMKPVHVEPPPCTSSLVKDILGRE